VTLVICQTGYEQPDSNRNRPKLYQAVAGLPRVSLEDAAAAAKALGWIRRGMDLADGLHLARAEGGDVFFSFDQDFAKAPNALGGINVRTP
jgi:hypothetical protein